MTKTTFAWRPSTATPAVVFFLCLVVGGALVSVRLLDVDITEYGPAFIANLVSPNHPQISSSFVTSLPSKIEIPLNCTTFNVAKTCPKTLIISEQGSRDLESSSSCPDYYRWIYEDLRPWREKGITLEMVERARKTANFRLVVVNGTAYVEWYWKAFQTRDTFTLWGILQLLRRYPGQLLDLDLMFDCVDWPVVLKKDYIEPNVTAQQLPPPLFRYCGNDQSFDIVFPDWSFWGWPEVNIKPWEDLLKDLKEGNKKTKWMDREPYAYWRGNPDVAETRRDLIKCNITEKHDWGARLYAQDWGRESQQGFKQSDLANQCIHRYKIYIEGSAWSVSEKYILACNSVTFIVKPHYYDFFTRGLQPLHHYWPIKEGDKCRSIEFGVHWGNNHNQEAQDMGKAASEFIQEELKMDYVYDYMFHLLNEYAKLLKFKPRIPEKAVEFCSETMACQAKGGLERKFMEESMVKVPSSRSPCVMPPPYDAASLGDKRSTRAKSIERVESWEKNYWKNQSA